MPRKAYSEQERERVKEALMAAVLQCIVDRGLIHSSIDALCRKVGISKTFFYSLFASKEELVCHALRYQQPRLLAYAQQLMENPSLSWRAGVETFLKDCCHGAKSGVAVLSIERAISEWCTAVSRRRISRLSGGIRLVFMAGCWLSLASRQTASTPVCSATWLWP